jgi:hypothetical protein
MTNFHQDQFEASQEDVEAMIVQMKQGLPKALKREQGERKARNKQIQEAWGPALKQYDALVRLIKEAGLEFANTFGPEAEHNNRHQFFGQMLLHGRASLIATEIYVLLRNGYASAAMGRWRTLDELAVIGLFLRVYGEDAAKRFVDHRDIANWKMLESAYLMEQEVGVASAEEPVLLQEARTRRDELVKLYGDTFVNDYGWASEAMKDKKPKFDKIRARVDQHFYKFFSGRAHHSVHATPGSIDASIPDPLLRWHGIVNTGDATLVTPASLSLITYHQCTMNFFQTRPSSMTTTILIAIRQLIFEAIEAFEKVEKSLLGREKDTDVS